MLSRYLIEACEDGDAVRVKHMINEETDVNAVNRDGQSCLMIACRRGQCEMVSVLIQSGANVNQINNSRYCFSGKTALDVCLSYCQLDCLKLLAANGLAVDFTSHKDDNVERFLSSIDSKQTPYIEILLGVPWRSRGHKISTLELLGATCMDEEQNLRRAYTYWWLALEERLLAEPCDQVQAKVEKAHPAYGHSREFLTDEDLDSIEMSEEAMAIQALIIRERILGPNNSKTYHFISARAELYFAAGNHDRCIAMWLHVFDMQVQWRYGMRHDRESPLTSLVKAFTFMISTGTAIRCEDVLAAFSNAVQTVAFAMERGSISDRHNFGTFLNLVIQCVGVLVKLQPQGAIRNRFLENVVEFVELNPHQHLQSSPLHFACELQDTWFPTFEVVELLIHAGANPKVKCRNGDTPLHTLARTSALTGRDNHRLINLLLFYGAPYCDVNWQGKSFIQYLPQHMTAHIHDPTTLSFGHLSLC